MIALGLNKPIQPNSVNMEAIRHILAESMPKNYTIQVIENAKEETVYNDIQTYLKKIGNSKIICLIHIEPRVSEQYYVLLINGNVFHFPLDISEANFRTLLRNAQSASSLIGCNICNRRNEKSSIIYVCQCLYSTCLKCRLETIYEVLSIVNSDKLICHKCLRDSYPLIIKDASGITCAEDVYAYLIKAFYLEINKFEQLQMISKEFAKDMHAKINILAKAAGPSQ